MLVFNEGLPRSGKSYDTIKNHILPALASGRRVYARLNGVEEADKRRAIADYLKIDVSVLDSLLFAVPTSKVRETFAAVRNEAGEWIIPPDLCDSLCVIDECHTFYVASREAISPAIEEFFALIGQSGGDVVLMTQWYRRLHSSVRGRVERKNVFQKLTAVGLEGKYSVKRYHATAPERFEKVTTDTYAYDPAIFPMYRGYSPASENRTVYKGGGQTVWRKLGKYAVFVVPLFLLAIWQLSHFFSKDSGLARESSRVAVSSPSPRPVTLAPPVPSAAGPVPPAAPRHAKMDDGQAYVFDLAGKGRARLAGVVSMPGAPALGLVEWVQGDTVVERLSLAQIRELGVSVDVHGYGVRLSVGKDVQLVTSWPLPPPAPTSDASSGAAASSVVPSSHTTTSGSLSTPTDWGDRPTARAYVPPELVPHPALYGG